jgi:hypothetical protein
MVVVLLVAILPIIFTVESNVQYNELQEDFNVMETYYETDYTMDYLDNVEYVFGTIRTKRNDINYWTYRVEIYDFEGEEDIYLRLEQEFDYDIDIVMIYNNDKLVFIKEVE